MKLRKEKKGETKKMKHFKVDFTTGLTGLSSTGKLIINGLAKEINDQQRENLEKETDEKKLAKMAKKYWYGR